MQGVYVPAQRTFCVNGVEAIHFSVSYRDNLCSRKVVCSMSSEHGDHALQMKGNKRPVTGCTLACHYVSMLATATLKCPAVLMFIIFIVFVTRVGILVVELK